MDRKDYLINKFVEFEETNETYLTRFLNILKRQVENQGKFVGLFAKYPVNSVEFKVEVTKLYNEISPILDEFIENNDNLISNGKKFIEVLELLDEEIEQLPKDWDEE